MSDSPPPSPVSSTQQSLGDDVPRVGGEPLKVYGIISAATAPELVKEAVSTHYKYIIVGGGTAGLVLAARLSEDPENSVLVLEAGPLQLNNPKIDLPSNGGSLCGSDLDWNYTGVPQKHLNGRSMPSPRGKLLGGSSCLNMMMYNRGHLEDFNSWSILGNPKWDWKSLLHYHRRSEHFHPSTGNNLDVRPSYKEKAHGHEGPVQTSYSKYLSPQIQGFFEGLREAGIPESRDPNGGKTIGVGYCPSSVDPRTDTRSSAESAYLGNDLNPQARKNLCVITSAQATRINFSKTLEDGLVVARSVTFVVTDQPLKVYNIKCTSEVLLCGGAVNSPQLLELSGIGDSARLAALGLPVVVDLPGVGENLQDHPTVLLKFRLKPGHESLDNLSDPHLVKEAQSDYQHHTGLLSQAVPVLAYATPNLFLSPADVAQGKRLIELETKGGLSHKQQMRYIGLYDDVPKLEFMAINGGMDPSLSKGRPGSSFITVGVALQHSLSRGSIHINSGNPVSKPTINHRYLSHPSDIFFLVQGAKFIRKLADTHGFGQHVEKEVVPGQSKLGSNASQKDWEEWVREALGSEHHLSGTCSMLPRDGGVVSPELVVYGTANLRVIDMSISPLLPATHTQSTAYCIGEKGADLILSV